jgi:hypothetical protein
MDQAACATGDGTLDTDFFPRDDEFAHGPATRRARLKERRAKAKCNGAAAVVQIRDDGVPIVTSMEPCPVREQCLAWAMKVEHGWSPERRHGIYGGMNARERYLSTGAELPDRFLDKTQRGGAA